MDPTAPSATPAEMRGYISDMLSQLAEIARRCDPRLETALRLLALDAASPGPPGGDKALS